MFRVFSRATEGDTRATYRLEETCGEVLVNGKVTLLLDTEAARDGGLLSSSSVYLHSNRGSRYTHRRSLEGRGDGTTASELEHDEYGERGGER